MKDEAVKKLLKISRVEKDISGKDIAENINISNPLVTKIEKQFMRYSVTRYLLYLRKRGVDINLLFDSINKNEKK